MSESPLPVPVYTFAKNGREEVRACLTEFNRHKLAELRVYFPAPDGSMRPTAKGLTVNRALLPELEAAVRALREAEGG